MQAPTQPFIDGDFTGSARGGRAALVNPATEENLVRSGRGGPDTAERAVGGAHRAFNQVWRDLAPGKRAEVLFAITRLIREYAEELAQLDVRSVGKPISDARDEVALGATVFEYYAGAVGKFFGQTIPVARGGFDFTIRQPMGVVAAIVPWNFPFPITCWKVAPALAAGNCVVLKPAQVSPVVGAAPAGAGGRTRRACRRARCRCCRAPAAKWVRRSYATRSCERCLLPARRRSVRASCSSRPATSNGCHWSWAASHPTSSSPTRTWNRPRRVRR